MPSYSVYAAAAASLDLLLPLLPLLPLLLPLLHGFISFWLPTSSSTPRAAIL
jgi:hypothetical protein